MNSFIIKITSVILIVAGIISAFVFLPKPLLFDINSIQNLGTETAIILEDEDSVNIAKIKSNGTFSSDTFKVLCFTDLHITGIGKECYETLDKMIKNIERENPDLVVMTGDIIVSALNYYRTKQFCEIFEKLGVYWAPILGNHEGENPFSISREKMCSIFSSYEHCLMKKGADGVWGNGNYAVNIFSSQNKLIETLYLIDTGNIMSDEMKKKYGYSKKDSPNDIIKDSQVQWYKKTVNQNKMQYGKSKSLMFLHIPIPQFNDAYNNGKIVFGDKRENISCSVYDGGIYNEIKELGSTTSIFCGHDHVNDFLAEYDGLNFCYIQKGGYESYDNVSKFGDDVKDRIQGYTVINIESNGDISIKQELNKNYLY